MVQVSFPSGIDQRLLKFAVIAARYQDKWLFCRHKERATWEIPGGHREPDESIEDAARRELWEETGAEPFEIQPVSVYQVTKDKDASYGMLYFAKISRLGALPPHSEMEEIRLFDCLPKELTYPNIQAQLYNYIQNWLNLQSSPDELWDVYDQNRLLAGRVHRRGDPLPDGDYHLVVHVWLQNNKGEFLLTRRAPNKGFPNMWECTGGSALSGDDSITAAIREVREETGLCLLPENGRCVMGYKRKDAFVDIWLFRQDFDLKDVRYQPGETCGAKCAKKEEILEMEQTGELVPFSYLEEFFRKIH